LYAIDGAGRQAKFAAGTFTGEDRMHELVCTDDRVHGTDVSAMRASNAKYFIDKRYRILHISVRGIRKCNKIAAEQVGYPLDRTFATRRA